VQFALSYVVHKMQYALLRASSTCNSDRHNLLEGKSLRHAPSWYMPVAWAVLSLSVVNTMMQCGLGRLAESSRGTRTRKGVRRCHEAMDWALHKGADKSEAGWAGRLRLAQAAFACARNAATRNLMLPANPATRNPAPSAGQR